MGSGVTLEMEYWKTVFVGLAKPRVKVVPYLPRYRKTPGRMLQVQSAWKGIESILADLIERFEIQPRRCLEFGVEFGYSTVALSSYFDSVTGVDLFIGDKHTVNRSDLHGETVRRLASFENVRLIRSDYRAWIRQDDTFYDFIHVDIVHTFADTFACGLWSVNHAKCVIFHDTESFPAVKKAVAEIARRTGRTFYNFAESHGLGILI
jgi:hypothetical protein